MTDAEEPVSTQAPETKTDESNKGDSAYAKQQHGAFRVVSKAVRREQFAGRNLGERSWTNWMTDPHVWYRHPILRMLIPFVITGLDLYMYVEDPLNDAHVPYNVPFQGHALGLMAFWAAPTGGLAMLRLGLTLISWVLAAIVGRQFVVGVVLRRCVRLSCFQGGSEGTLVVVFLLAGCSMFASALFYNLVVTGDRLDGTSNDIFLIFGAQSEQYRHVNQCWQALSLLVDLLTILTVWDVCLQDEVRYPHFLPKIKEVWIRSYDGWVRVLFAWICFMLGAVPIIWTVFLTGPGQGQISAPAIFGGSDEVVRNVCAGVLVFVDLLVTVQDWDFPTFEEPLEIQVPTKVLGTFHDRLKITWMARLLKLIPQPSWSCWKRLCQYLPGPEFFQVSIRGKWLQYGPLCCVMFIDLAYSRTQLIYDPSYYGQYVDLRDSFIWSITDQATLETAYEGGYLKENASHLISFEARWNTTSYEPFPFALTDVKGNSRFMNSGMKYLALWISTSALVSFACCLCTADWRRARLLQEIKREEEQGTGRGASEESGDVSGPVGLTAAPSPQSEASSLHAEII
ncbi:unnamed protein product [Durusdinium trenchii]|uniref:Transmembrane protein n=1 Tax=Durusdinium trenchii TaxID=1381693 RepID=A0ABP0PKU2_9DINO